MRRFPAWSVVAIATASLLAGIVAGRVPWQEWMARPRGGSAGGTARAQTTATQHIPIGHIDRTNLDEYARFLAEAAWWREEAEQTDTEIHVTNVEIARKEPLNRTLVPGRLVTLAVVHVAASWPKFDADVLMILQPTRADEAADKGYLPWSTMLQVTCHYGLVCRVVNIGGDRDRYALMVKTKSPGNGPHETTTSLYLADQELGDCYTLRKVLSAPTSYMHPEWGDARWQMKSVEFRDGGRALKDVVVTAHVEKWHGEPDWSKEDPDAPRNTPDYYKIQDEDRVSVFRWNGDRYVGHMSVGK